MKPDSGTGAGQGAGESPGGTVPATGSGARSTQNAGRATASAAVRQSPKARARQEAARGHAQLARRHFRAAVESFRQAVALEPGEAVYHAGLAAAADGAGDDGLLEAHAGEAVRLDPDDALPHHLLARWHYRHGRLDRATEHAVRSVALSPDDVEYVVLHATLLFEAGRAGEARDAIDRPLAAGSTDPWLAHLYARIAPAVMQEEAALRTVERALAAPPPGGGAGNKPLLHFAAAALLDRMGQYTRAFEQARRGNEMSRDAASAHETARHGEWVSRKIRYFTPERVESLPRATHDSRRPVFVLGMPRSGTSLVEQILGCHPQVHPGGELQALRLVARDSADADWAAGESYPEYFDDLSVGRANRLAAQYLAAIDALDRGASTYVTDKQPLNFLILDMVELLFPRSRVIHCVRNPLDTCLSCYMTLFAEDNPYKFDLADLGAYYRDYQRLMDHWKRVLTVPVLELRYEDLVLDTRGQVRRMLDFLELPWDDRCLRYYENPRVARTASVDQVRRPIYTASIGRWKHYEKELGPLIKALGTAG